MRKIFNWVLAATLVCGATAFTACTSDNGDNPAVDEGLAEKVLGKWILSEVEGQPMFSRSIVDYSSLPDGWQLYRRLLAEQPDRSV